MGADLSVQDATQEQVADARSPFVVQNQLVGALREFKTLETKNLFRAVISPDEMSQVRQISDYLYVRDCYKNLYTAIMNIPPADYLDGRSIIGSSGIGKTMFGAYYATRAFHELNCALMFYLGYELVFVLPDVESLREDYIKIKTFLTHAGERTSEGAISKLKINWMECAETGKRSFISISTKIDETDETGSLRIIQELWRAKVRWQQKLLQFGEDAFEASFNKYMPSCRKIIDIADTTKDSAWKALKELFMSPIITVSHKTSAKMKMNVGVFHYMAPWERTEIDTYLADLKAYDDSLGPRNQDERVLKMFLQSARQEGENPFTKGTNLERLECINHEDLLSMAIRKVNREGKRQLTEDEQQKLNAKETDGDNDEEEESPCISIFTQDELRQLNSDTQPDWNVVFPLLRKWLLCRFYMVGGSVRYLLIADLIKVINEAVKEGVVKTKATDVSGAVVHVMPHHKWKFSSDLIESTFRRLKFSLQLSLNLDTPKKLESFFVRYFTEKEAFAALNKYSLSSEGSYEQRRDDLHVKFDDKTSAKNEHFETLTHRELKKDEMNDHELFRTDVEQEKRRYYTFEDEHFPVIDGFMYVRSGDRDPFGFSRQQHRLIFVQVTRGEGKVMKFRFDKNANKFTKLFNLWKELLPKAVQFYLVFCHGFVERIFDDFHCIFKNMTMGTNEEKVKDGTKTFAVIQQVIKKQKEPKSVTDNVVQPPAKKSRREENETLPLLNLRTFKFQVNMLKSQLLQQSEI